MKTILLLSLLFVGQLSAQRTTVSIVQLIANPEKYDGKIVRFEGVTNIEFEGNAIYLSKEHWKAHVTSFAIWMNLSADLSKYNRWLNGKYCILEGTFHADDRGHLGLYVASLSDITMFSIREPISLAEEKKLIIEAEQAATGDGDKPAN